MQHEIGKSPFSHLPFVSDWVAEALCVCVFGECGSSSYPKLRLVGLICINLFLMPRAFIHQQQWNCVSFVQAAICRSVETIKWEGGGGFMSDTLLHWTLGKRCQHLLSGNSLLLSLSVLQCHPWGNPKEWDRQALSKLLWEAWKI